MTTSQKSKLTRTNTLLWLMAMVLPAIFHFSLASSKFPWPVILPLLLLGPMLASNTMLARASGNATDDAA
jgi:hypothetical protein